MSNTRSGRGMRCDEAPIYYRSVSSKGAGRPCLTHHHKGWWNGTKWMRWRWRNGGMKFVVGENGRHPAKNLPRPRFVHHETNMEWPRRELGTPAVGGERLTACATRPLALRIFSRYEHKCCIKIEIARGNNAPQCHRALLEACGRETLPYSTVTRRAYAFHR